MTWGRVGTAVNSDNIFGDDFMRIVDDIIDVYFLFSLMAIYIYTLTVDFSHDCM